MQKAHEDRAKPESIFSDISKIALVFLVKKRKLYEGKLSAAKSHIGFNSNVSRACVFFIYSCRKCFLSSDSVRANFIHKSNVKERHHVS